MNALAPRGFSPRLLPAILATLAVVAVGTATPSYAAIFNYIATLNGLNEAPSNGSPGVGSALVQIDDVANTMAISATFSGLIGTVTASHIHAATAIALTGTVGVATTTPTFPGFPSGVTAGVYVNTLDLTLATSYNPSYVTANGGTTATARTALLLAMAAGKSYFNIHSTTFGGGEIRGFLVPNPATPTHSATWGRIKSSYR